MTEKTPTTAIDVIMEQVQVFASTYSLAGGRFDDGTKFQQSEEEKAEVRMMIVATIAGLETESDEFRDTMSAIALYLSVGSGDDTTSPESYHKRIIWGIENVTDRLTEQRDELRKRVERLEGALSKVKTWAEQKCPCENEEPNPCPLCGASVENLENCKAVDRTFPKHIIAALDLRRAAIEEPKP